MCYDIFRVHIYTESREQVCLEDGSFIQISTPCEDSLIDRTFVFGIYDDGNTECNELIDFYAYFQDPKSGLYLTRNE